ncbi:hypothetical protein C8P66_10770 [Humitalea rosea]|uniref:Carbonic anhydrase n=1 Tax=Humitalea rosea TaxID=990373 RepID=A0A2W7IJZ9_9PROT|nr:hypothetical protein [Humitalea rosea]PZW47032.1 hypothetical protein C8P66_10770 [Humitalea rosea]
MTQKAETFLLACIDPRLIDDSGMYFAAIGRGERYSEMRVAGAALALADPARAAWAATIWENLAASRQLHGVTRVTLLNHRDCGAMAQHLGRPFADAAEEERLHADVLARAAEAVRARHPDMRIETKLMELDGRVSILPCAVCAPRGPLVAEAVAPPAARAGFAELVRLRARDGTAGSPDVLTQGVTRYGLSAEEVRQVLAAERGAPPAAQDVAAFLRSRQDGRGRIGRQAVGEAARLYRRLAGPGTTPAESQARATSIAAAEGLAPRPEGWPLFRSTRWFDVSRGASSP